MKLENIGFYTLSDERAKTANEKSDMQRCEIVLTDRCNFNCPYCRGLRKDCSGDLPLKRVKRIIDFWAEDNLQNIRFSGGEPTVYPKLRAVVRYAKKKGVKRIAISTNGSANLDYYWRLVDDGVNDFSVSLDACCALLGKKMAGSTEDMWDKVVDNIKWLSKATYVTVGMVFTEDNVHQVMDGIKFAHSLGVSDIRIISSAQYNKAIEGLKNLNGSILGSHPILKYRVNNYRNNRNVRGMKPTDFNRCPLVLDDSAVAGKYHFPCIIYMREHGDPIGYINNDMRHQRLLWVQGHNTYKDKICRENCLDVCIDYNNAWREYHHIGRRRLNDTNNR